MSPNIDYSYVLSTGHSYEWPPQAWWMVDYAKMSPLERIQEAMRDAGKGVTQGAIAKQFGISQPSVHEWGAGTPELQRAIQIGQTLNVCVEWILTGRGPKRPGPPMEIAAQKLWDLWGRIPELERGELIGLAEARASPSRAASSRTRSIRAKSSGFSSGAP
jgi:DNA-binding XRE family transcriptional regulator